MAVTDTLAIEDARIMFRNFSGRASKYNAEGKRNFAVIIEDPNMAHNLAAEGWNVKMLAPRSDDEEPRYYMTVNVSYDFRPPKVYLVTGIGHNKTQLTEDTIGHLDFADISHIDMVIQPYNWEIGDKTGVKGYLRTMYVTLEEDVFASKYNEYDSNDDDVPFM